MNNYVEINVLLPTLLSSELLLFLPSMSRLRHFWKGSEAKQGLGSHAILGWHAISSFNLTRFHPHDHCFLSAILHCNQLRSIADILLLIFIATPHQQTCRTQQLQPRDPNKLRRRYVATYPFSPSIKLLEALKR